MSTDADETSQNRTLSEGQIFMGRYQILSVLGRGGVGVVYKARHTHMDKLVAIKTLLDTVVTTDAESFQRFEREARTASNLDHTNIIRIFDFGKAESGVVFLVMEYLGDRTLENLLIEKGRLDVDHFFSIASQICDGLQNAHKHNVIHRDIKPSNIMLVKADTDEECVKIVDFGLAKLSTKEAAQSLTQTGAIIGTPLFMSPEQCRGLALDPRSDIYSLGCVFYLALTGRVPIQGTTALDTLFQHTILKPKSFAEAGVGSVYSPRLETVIFKALEKEPDMRHQSMLEFRSELQKAILEPGFRSSGTAAVLPVDYTQTVVSLNKLPGSTRKLRGVESSETAPFVQPAVKKPNAVNKPAIIASTVALIAIGVAVTALSNKTTPAPAVEKKYFFPTSTATTISQPASLAKTASTPSTKPAAVVHKAEKPVVRARQPKIERKPALANIPVEPAPVADTTPDNAKSEHEQLASLFAAGKVQLAQKDWVSAQKSYDACSRLQAKMFGARNYRLFPTLSTLMHCQMMQNDAAHTRANLMVALDVFTREQSTVLQDVSAKPMAAKIWRNMATVCRIDGAPTADMSLLKWSADFYELARNAWQDKSDVEYQQMCRDYCRVLELCGNRKKENQIRAEIGTYR